jgi:hypothetical protein
MRLKRPANFIYGYSYININNHFSEISAKSKEGISCPSP